MLTAVCTEMIGKLAFSQVENFVENGGFFLFRFGQSDPQNSSESKLKHTLNAQNHTKILLIRFKDETF